VRALGAKGAHGTPYDGYSLTRCNIFSQTQRSVNNIG
jgi:hypothetical protein